MNLKVLIASVLFIQVSLGTFAQTKANSNISILISKQKSGEDQIKYSDSTFGYSVIVPKWWAIKETPSPNFFGGTFPEIEKSESALLFKSFEKEKFKTLDNFQKWVITGYRSGDIPKWSDSQKVLYIKNLSDFSAIGKAFKVQLKSEDTFYNSCYIIVETSRSFLWIDLTAKRETYDVDFKKFEKLMSQFTAF